MEILTTVDLRDHKIKTSQKLDQKWKSNGYWQVITGSNQALIILPLPLPCSY